MVTKNDFKLFNLKNEGDKQQFLNNPSHVVHFACMPKAKAVELFLVIDNIYPDVESEMRCAEERACMINSLHPINDSEEIKQLKEEALV